MTRDIEEVEIEMLLENKWEISKSVFNDFFTKTHYFLMPLISSKLIFNKEFSKHYLNSFLNDELKILIIDQTILLHFKTTDIFDESNSISWDKIRSIILSLGDEYKYHYYVGNNSVENEVVFALKVNDEFSKDFKKIISGKYSKTSDNYKRRVLHYFYKDVNLHKILKGILYKEDWVREEVSEVIESEIPKNNEVWDTFLSRREIFRNS